MINKTYLNLLETLTKSFMYELKRICPKADIWTTPQVIFLVRYGYTQINKLRTIEEVWSQKTCICDMDNNSVFSQFLKIGMINNYMYPNILKSMLVSIRLAYCITLLTGTRLTCLYRSNIQKCLKYQYCGMHLKL